MEQRIHILDADVLPEEGVDVTTNCGVVVPLRPIRAYWSDGRVCEECLRLHRSSESRRYTSALLEVYSPEEQSMRVRDHWKGGDSIGPISDQSGINALKEFQNLIS